MIYIPTLLVIMVPAISLLLCICYAVYLSVKHDLPYLKAYSRETSNHFRDETGWWPAGIYMILTLWPLSVPLALLFFIVIFYPYRLLLFTVKNLKKKD